MVPQWMAFPPTAYTSRGGVGSVKAAARVAFDLSAPAYLDPDQQDRVSGAEDTPLAAQGQGGRLRCPPFFQL